MKILHLTISSEIGGGPEHIFQLIKGTSTQFESHVACPDNGAYYQKFLELTSNRVTFLPHREFRFKALFSLIKYIKKNKIDLLHGHGKGAGFYCRLINIFLRMPAIHTPHGINKKIEEGISNKIYITFERLFSYLISYVIFVSNTESEYAKTLKLWTNVPSVIINNGTAIITELEMNSWRDQKRQELCLKDKRIVITASRFDFQKNTKEFCEIASYLPHHIFVILGDGEEKKNCEEYCLSLNINNILFIGNTKNPLHYFAAADIYLSTARWEGLSMAILEAMSLGLPVVASEVIGNIDLVKSGENGFLYNLGNISEAVGYLSEIFDSGNYLHFSNNARNFHKISFSSDSMSYKTALLYTGILNKKRDTNKIIKQNHREL